MQMGHTLTYWAPALQSLAAETTSSTDSPGYPPVRWARKWETKSVQESGAQPTPWSPWGPHEMQTWAEPNLKPCPSEVLTSPGDLSWCHSSPGCSGEG